MVIVAILKSLLHQNFIDIIGSTYIPDDIIKWISFNDKKNENLPQ